MRSLLLLCLYASVPLCAQDTSAVRLAHDSVTVRFVQTDLRAVIQALGRYLPKPVLVGSIQPAAGTVETPTPVPRAAPAGDPRGIVEAQGLPRAADSPFFPVA